MVLTPKQQDQEQWLFEEFKKSDVAWNIMAQGQLVAQLRQKDRTGMAGRMAVLPPAQVPVRPA